MSRTRVPHSSRTGTETPGELRPVRPLYVPTWWERRFPWLLDLILKLDPEPLERRVASLFAPFGRLLALVCEPPAAVFEVVGWALSRSSARLGERWGAIVRALPLPGVVQDILWLRPPDLRRVNAVSAHQVWRAQHRRVVAVGLIVATLVHLASFAFWPAMQAEDFSFTATELSAVEIPPEIEIPPPPQQIARPATPVIGNVDIADDITIAPTTFEENPVRELPPPPEEEEAVVENRPTITPFTVAPELQNADEVRRAMVEEYPPLLRDAGVGGRVVMWFFLDDTGIVERALVAQSSGHPSLDAAAMRVAPLLRFSPALNRDLRVPVWVQFPLDFVVRRPEEGVTPAARPAPRDRSPGAWRLQPGRPSPTSTRTGRADPRAHRR